MKNKERFDNSIKVLVKAYLEGTLLHEDSCACAIGNLIAAHNNYKMGDFAWLTEEGEQIIQEWYVLGVRECSQLECIGYTLLEVIKIEHAFESANDNYDDPDGYKGLIAVFNVLVQIHKGSDKQLKLAKDKLLKI